MGADMIMNMMKMARNIIMRIIIIWTVIMNQRKKGPNGKNFTKKKRKKKHTRISTRVVEIQKNMLKKKPKRENILPVQAPSPGSNIERRDQNVILAEILSMMNLRTKMILTTPWRKARSGMWSNLTKRHSRRNTFHDESENKDDLDNAMEEGEIRNVVKSHKTSFSQKYFP